MSFLPSGEKFMNESIMNLMKIKHDASPRKVDAAQAAEPQTQVAEGGKPTMTIKQGRFEVKSVIAAILL